ncbi:CAP domain-containing protein [Massilia sp. UMI-21]|nr:CAP domain-containing protein [Massilia sp. UMI-21]
MSTLSFEARPCCHAALRHALPFLFLLAAVRPGVAAGAPAPADGAEQLTALVNAYRMAPGDCMGRAAAPVAALTPHPALARVRIGPATFTELALEAAGYAAERAVSVSVNGPQTPAEAMTVLQQKYCSTLLDTHFSVIGSYRAGKEWTVILARPAPPLPSETFPDWHAAGKAVLAGVNAARASARNCGSQQFAAAPPLSWNPQLGEAALAHSRDMAARRYFSHRARDGSQPADRATRAGYAWQRVGENIAFGQSTPDEAVAGWLDSPGHCANIMHPGFTEMGAAYGVAAEKRSGIVYWTQVFGRPR